ncbi:MAG TPA: RHS repeat-associated core domain-containing protein [Candidatus Limnocylindrales bacterium]|nr:RHS repeat-associated core domain-containing protein [Candidatus Limnocylindrales bacterium]
MLRSRSWLRNGSIARPFRPSSPRPGGPSRWATVLLAVVTALSTLGAGPIVVGPSGEKLGEGPSGGQTATATTIYDNFNRVSANPFWGFASSGFSWQTDNVSGQCTGYTSSVDGQQGIVTGAATGAGCAIWGSLLHVNYPGPGGAGPWKAPSWTFTAKVRVAAVNGTRIRFAMHRNFANYPFISLGLAFDPTAGGVDLGFTTIPFAWQANTWYTVKWVQAWGNQERVKVWLSSQGEPTDWLGVRSEAGEDYSYDLADSAFGVWVDSRTTSNYDDFSFGPAPILPPVPPPPGTDRNPPFVNGESGGDPVSTGTGAFNDTHVDIAIPGRGPTINFARSYNSNDTRTTTLGPGWTHSYNVRLTSPGDGSSDVILVGGQGRSDRYSFAAGAFSPPKGVHRSLIKNADDTYTATDKDQTTWQFDASGLLTQVRDRFGNASNLSYDGNARLATVSDPAGRGSLTFGYTNGLLTSVVDWASPARTWTYQYDGNGRLWKAVNREGKTTTYTYDGASQRIATVTDGRGIVTLVNTYDPAGRVATQKDGRGVVTGEATVFDYATNPDGTFTTTLTLPPTSFEPAFHPTMADTYDSHGWLIGRVTRPTSSDTLSQVFTYDTSGNQTSLTDPRGARTDVCYDVTYAGTSVPGGAANVTRTIGPAPSPGEPRPVTLLKYDARNNLIQTVSARGVPSVPTVSCGTDLSAINPQFATDQTYDAAGIRLMSQTRRFTDPDTGPKAATTSYEYTDAANPGRTTRIIPPRGNATGTPDLSYSTVMTYNASGAAAGLLKDIADAGGNRTSYTYDALGRVVSLVDPLGNAAGGVAAEHTTTFTYDREDRQRTTSLPGPTAGAAPIVTETRYDAVGNPTVRIDANGQVTSLLYDERSSLLRVTQSAAPWTDPAVGAPTPIVTEYLHDAGGNATRITLAQGDAANERVTDYTFDGRGLKRSETQYPSWPSTSGSLVTAYLYDSDGNQTSMIDPLGRTTTYGYDARNRLSAIDYSDSGTPDVSLSYDPDGNQVGMTDGTGTSTYAFDESSQLITATTPGPSIVGYRYDLDGHRTKLIYPDSTAVSYNFNKSGQLGSLTDWASRSVTYSYWPDGLVRGAALPDGTGATYTYDNARRLVDVLHQRLATIISHQAYALDRAGNVISVTDQVSGLTPVPVWSSPAAVNDVQTADQTRPAMALAPDGSVSAVWVDSRTGDSDIYYARRDPATGTWSASERVNNLTTGAQTQPAIAVDGAGNAYVVWADARLGASDDDIYFAKRTALSGGWTASTRVNNDGSGKRQNDPTIAISSSGVALAAWYDERGGGNKKNIYSARLAAGGTTWSANFQVTKNASAIKAEPDVAIGADGTGYLVWRDQQSGNADIWFSSLPNNGTTWSTNAKISDDPGTAAQDSPDIGVDTAGNLLVAWNDGRTTPSQIRVRKRPAGTTTWSASTSIGGLTSNAPSIAVRPDGRAYLAWSNGTLGTLTTVWGAEYDPATGTWTSPEQLTVGSEEAASAAVAFSNGQLVVSYQRRPTGGNYDIFSRRKSLGGEQSSFGYDALSRLVSVSGPDGPRSYSYDPVGNRLTRVAGSSTTYTYDRADRMTGAGGVPVSTDANGNIVARGSDTYSYDQANRLAVANVGGATETYRYDGLGTRFSRQVGAGSPTRYVSDVGAALPTLIADGSNKYVYGLGLAYAVSGSAIEVYHNDRLATTRAITSASGTVTAGYRADEWGVPRASSGASTQPFGYAGEPADGTGLDYMRARYYSPDLGRFMSRDWWMGSVATPQTLNRYAYVANNPVTRNDPSGSCVVDSFVDIGFVIFDFASLAFGPPKDRHSNMQALGLDMLGLLVPCVTGLGLGYRAGRAAEEGIDRGIAVIGHYSDRVPDYRALGDWLGAKYFNVPEDVWKGLSEAEQKALNQDFLDDIVRSGDDVLLSNSIDDVRPGSALEWEIDYLLNSGYVVSPEGWKLLAP